MPPESGPPIYICQASAGHQEDANANVANDVQRLYVNCGRWQLGSTDFVVVSKYNVVLCTWLSDSETSLFEQLERTRKVLLKIQSSDPKLAAFIRGKFEYAQGFKAAQRIFVTAHKTLKVRKEKFQLTDDELIVVVPDCHITMFKDWTMDGFCKPALDEKGEPTETSNGYPLYPESLEKDFLEFLSYARTEVGNDRNCIHVGDLLDYWHTHWMFELAFDIYREALLRDINSFFAQKFDPENPFPKDWDSWKVSNTRKRFPVELLADTGTWKTKSNKKDGSKSESAKPHYDWWRHFHKYLDISFDAPIHEATEQLLKEVAMEWPKKIAPHDVIAIIWWGLSLKWYATPLSEEDFKSVKDYLEDLADADNWFWSLFKSPPTTSHPGYKAIGVLKSKMKKGAEALDFLNRETVKSRIYAQYEKVFETAVDKFIDGKNYVRGNHDCTTPNKYLVDKFLHGKSEKQLYKSYLQEGKWQDANADELPDDITFKRGTGGKKIVIEHGDAWDLNNNDLSYFLFLKGKAIDGGYHTPKSVARFGPSYIKQQLESPGSPLHWFFKKAGDLGLEAPAEDRARAIFFEHSEVRVIVMGHTHIPKITEYKSISLGSNLEKLEVVK